MNFKKFHFHPTIEAGIEAVGYTTPTPVQAQSIPIILEGKDILALAQTGTGKTAAFALPILQRLTEGLRGRIRALIIAPTRELAEQIHEAIGGLSKQTRLRSVTIYGGVPINPQIQKLRKGVEIVVACPGRLLDHIRQKTINLSNLEVLVLDEADRMFDMGFIPDIRKILKYVPDQRQTLFFSATMPADIKLLAHDILRDPVTVQVDHAVPLATISHALYPVDRQQKTALLMEILRHTDTESVLVFTRTKQRARLVAQQLKKDGYNVTSLQGDMSQRNRQGAMNGFRNGTYKILVATDIAARGIDVSRISHVINYDIPDTAEAYTHRIGRTGRAAKTGDAFTIITREDEAMVRDIEKVLGSRLKRCKLEGFNYTTPISTDLPSSRSAQPGPRGRQSFGRKPTVRRTGFSSSPSRSAAIPRESSRRVAPIRHAKSDTGSMHREPSRRVAPIRHAKSDTDAMPRESSRRVAPIHYGKPETDAMPRESSRRVAPIRHTKSESPARRVTSPARRTHPSR
ncbi:MAG: box helicase domain protein [Candidatus Brocadiaceae bacterium]|nr:box helicase domain protein [Candidatus Brocadiaceae bacterium]